VISVKLNGGDVKIRAWCHSIIGISGCQVPVYFLDADLPENLAWERALTNSLYGGDEGYRLSQEAILGIGGVRSTRAWTPSNFALPHE
jgi:starch phosphorylase